MTLSTPSRPATFSKTPNVPVRKMPRMGWLEVVVVSQTLLPAALFIPGMTPVRAATRVLAFVLPLLAWAAVMASGRQVAGRRRYAAAGWLTFCTAWYVLSLAHPNCNSLASSTAEIALCVAIFSPAFWAPVLITDIRQIRRLIVVLLICNGASSLMGIGQVYRPETFRAPYIPVLALNSSFEESLSTTTDDGRKILRPSGLSDTPGAAGMAGLLTCLTGLAIALPPIAWWKRIIAVGMAIVGLTVMFYSQVRFVIIVLVVGLAVWAGLLALRREGRKLMILWTSVCILGFAATGWVLNSGGSSVMTRFLSLTEERSSTLYYQNRGKFVEYALTVELPEYPLGAGLGRTGTMNSYFGDVLAPPSRGSIYAETQIEIWVLDGGAPLLLGGGAAVIAAMIIATLTALRCPDKELGYWATVVVVFGLFNALSCLGNSPFVSPTGLQFWVLMGSLFGADSVARETAQQAKAAVPEPRVAS